MNIYIKELQFYTAYHYTRNGVAEWMKAADAQHHQFEPSHWQFLFLSLTCRQRDSHPPWYMIETYIGSRYIYKGD